MASTAQAYRNSGAVSSENLSPYAIREIIQYSALRDGARACLLASLRIADRGGTQVWCSVKSLAFETRKSPRTIQYHRKRLREVLGIARVAREANTWDACPKCKAERLTKTCSRCGYVGDSGKEFRRGATYEFDVAKIESFQPCPAVRAHRNHKEYRAAYRKKAASRATANGPASQQSPAPGPIPVVTPAARPEHRSTERALVTTQITETLSLAAARLMEYCGLPHIGETQRYIEAAILSESKYLNLEIGDAAKTLADCVLRDQRAGVTISRFYFQNVKWRSANGGQQRPSASSERNERVKRSIVDTLTRVARRTDPPDSS